MPSSYSYAEIFVANQVLVGLLAKYKNVFERYGFIFLKDDCGILSTISHPSLENIDFITPKRITDVASSLLELLLNLDYFDMLGATASEEMAVSLTEQLHVNSEKINHAYQTISIRNNEIYDGARVCTIFLLMARMRFTSQKMKIYSSNTNKEARQHQHYAI